MRKCCCKGFDHVKQIMRISFRRIGMLLKLTKVFFPLFFFFLSPRNCENINFQNYLEALIELLQDFLEACLLP